MSVVSRVKERVHEVREHRPLVDHAVRTVEHYGKVNGSLQAGAITYFAFLSFFPVLALSFAVVGYLARVYPDAQQDLVKAIDQVLPGLVGQGRNKVQLADLEAAAPGIFSVGILTVLYSGLGWLSALRTALLAVFEQPERDRPSFVGGKLHDLMALAALGVILMTSVTVSGVVTSLSRTILGWIGLGIGLEPVLWVLAVAVGIGASTLLFFAFFRLLGEPDAPARSLWSGALLGALGFEALKQLSRYLLASTTEQPAFQAFGIALVVVVWINYFSRVVVVAASWAHTTPEARAVTEASRQAALAVEGPAVGPALAAAQAGVPAGAPPEARPDARPDTQPDAGRRTDNRTRIALAAGGTAALVLAAAVTRRRP